MIQYIGHRKRSDTATGPRDKVSGNRLTAGEDIPQEEEWNGQDDLHG